MRQAESVNKESVPELDCFSSTLVAPHINSVWIIWTEYTTVTYKVFYRRGYTNRSRI
jgi:hypothetical protein